MPFHAPLPAIRCCVDRPSPLYVPAASPVLLPSQILEMAAETSKLWRPGVTLTVAFDHTSIKAERAEVHKAIAILQGVANVHFAQVVDPRAHLRIAFDDGGGSWSLVGTDCLHAQPNTATMNLGWRDDLARTIHELCHALGMIHEHQSPAAKIPWNRPALYAYYGGAPNFWPPAMVDEQVIAVYDQRTVTNTAFDKQSIMLYPIVADLVTDPAFATGWNQQLSPGDIGFLGQRYPRAA